MTWCKILLAQIPKYQAAVAIIAWNHNEPLVPLKKVDFTVEFRYEEHRFLQFHHKNTINIMMFLVPIKCPLAKSFVLKTTCCVDARSVST